MGYVNREWFSKPVPDQQLLEEAREWGMFIMHVCVQPAEGEGEPLSFITIAGSVPAVGDTIEVQNGVRATVLSALHKVTKLESGVFMLIPNIHARQSD